MDEIRTRKVLREHAGLEGEILQEIAEALGNTGERLDRAMEKLHESRGRIQELLGTLATLPKGDPPHELLDRYRDEVELHNRLREDALQCLRYLIIHREAVGFRNHRLVQEKYQIPAAIKLSEPWP